MKEFLKNIIVDPVSKEKLHEEKRDNQTFLCSGEKCYPVLNEVPMLLPDYTQTNQPNFKDDGQQEIKDYVNHYSEDALHFDYFKEESSTVLREELKRLHQSVIKKIPGQATLILDVGCGNGWLAKHFLTKNKKVISMDISSKNPVNALNKNPGGNHAAIVADAYFLPFEKNSFDAIVASEIMEHVYSPKLFISNLMEVLKPGGTLIITTPYNEKIEYYLCVHCNKPTPKDSHLHSINEKNIGSFIPEGVSYKTYKFSNKYISKLRLNVLTAFLPYSMWVVKDSIENYLFPKPLRFLLQITKP